MNMTRSPSWLMRLQYTTVPTNSVGHVIVSWTESLEALISFN